MVAPWEYLVCQLQQELHERFWKKVGEDSSFTPKPCQIFTPSTFTKAQKAAGSAAVLLCTNQTLQALRKDDAKFRKLRSWCTLALVDEGHRELAPRWAEAVRDLDVATVLFTATPYRNDLHLFDIDPAFTYSFTFGEALQQQIARNVSFIDGSWPLSGANAPRTLPLPSQVCRTRFYSTSLPLTSGACWKSSVTLRMSRSSMDIDCDKCLPTTSPLSRRSIRMLGLAI